MDRLEEFAARGKLLDETMRWLFLGSYMMFLLVMLGLIGHYPNELQR